MKARQGKSRRPILVTGGAGYIGSTLCRELLFRGYAVRAIDSLLHSGHSLNLLYNHPNFEFVRGDITKRGHLKSALEGVGDVIHLAAIVGDKPCERDPRSAVEVNLKATQQLAEMAKKAGISRFLFASTCSAYGVTDTNKPAAEDRELNPVSLYAETKIDCEEFLSGLPRNVGFRPVILRCSTAFGVSGRTRFDLTVNSFTYEALKYKRLIVFAEDTWRPFAHVYDIARIYCAFLELNLADTTGLIFNAGWTRQNHTKKEIVEIIKEVVGGVEVDYLRTVEDKRTYRVDFSRMEKAIGLLPKIDVRQGVRELASAIQAGFLAPADFGGSNLRQGDERY
jgi:nucleoside-diphosphate-sugar epimerase